MQRNEREPKLYTIYDARPGTGGPIVGAIEGVNEEDAIENWASLVAKIEKISRCDVDSEEYFAQDVDYCEEVDNFI